MIPNPWDTGTARILAGLGFKALATTSAGLAYGRSDLDDTLRRPQGSALARAALGAFLSAAREIQPQGTFSLADAAASFAELDPFMAETHKR